MRIALCQGPRQPGDVDRNLAWLEATASAARDGGARLLVCPEMFLTGYNIGAANVRALAEPSDGPSAARVARIARQADVAVLYGFPERDGDAIYNAVQLIDWRGERLAGYRKTHLYGELDRSLFAASERGLVRTELDGVRIGLLICYDVEFPEAARSHALAGVDLIVVPTALMRPYEIVARTIVPARAYENQVFLAYANRCDLEGELEYCGESCVVAPDGRDLARAGTGEQLVFADLDLDELHRSRKINTHLADRRPELYAKETAP